MKNKRKHLEFIQRIISRMAGNSFYLRGWTISLTGAFLVLASKDNSPDGLFYILILFVIIFWFLDGYFLSQERSYRDLYDKIRKLKEEEIDFSMDITKHKKCKRNNRIYSMLSPTLLIFYLSPIGALIYAVLQLN